MLYGYFLNLIAEWIRDKILADDPEEYLFCLIKVGGAGSEAADAYAWDGGSSLGAYEADFKGYSRIKLSDVGFTTITTPVADQRRLRTNPFNFAYDSGASGTLNNDVDFWAIIHDLGGGSHAIVETGFLPSTATFAADGDEKVYAWTVDDKNCVEV